MSDSPSPRMLGREDVFVMTTLDGSDTLYSRAFGSTYHSIKGAVSESRHVFILHGLANLAHLPSISILEMGFGTGLNAFLSFLFAQKHQKEISYTGIESFPIDILVARHLNYPSYLVADQWKDIFFSMHEEEKFSSDYFQFQKQMHLDDVQPGKSMDCIFFDAFALEVHPQLWEQNIFNRLFELTSPNGYLVTYCAKGEIRRRIEKAGYVVHRIPGAPGKREMIQAIKR